MTEILFRSFSCQVIRDIALVMLLSSTPGEPSRLKLLMILLSRTLRRADEKNHNLSRMIGPPTDALKS